MKVALLIGRAVKYYGAAEAVAAAERAVDTKQRRVLTRVLHVALAAGAAIEIHRVEHLVSDHVHIEAEDVTLAHLAERLHVVDEVVRELHEHGALTDDLGEGLLRREPVVAPAELDEVDAVEAHGGTAKATTPR